MEPAPRLDVMVVRKPYVLRNIGLGLAVFGFAVSLFVANDYRLLALLGFTVTGGFLALMASSGSLRAAGAIEGAGLTVAGRLVLPREAVRCAWIERTADGVRVVLRRRFGRDVRLEAEGEDHARALLERLGQGPLQSVARFSSGSWAAGALAMFVGQCGATLFARHFHSSAFAFSVVATAVLFAALNEEMAIGADGILFSSLLGRQFVPFADILEVGDYGMGGILVLSRRKGRFMRRLDAAAAGAAIERIQTAIDAAKPEPDHVRRQLHRGGDVARWVARLRTLASGASYRGGTVARDAVWRVFEDPGSSASDRAAAAVVLGSVATPEDRARLREVAARIVSPRVRVAVERVADPAGDEALAEALAELEDEGAEAAGF